MNNDDLKTDYEKIIESIEEAPMTYLPAILTTVVQQCVKKGVFVTNLGLLTYVKNSIERIRQ